MALTFGGIEETPPWWTGCGSWVRILVRVLEYAGRMNQPLTIVCERCGKTATKTIEMNDSWGSGRPTRTDPVWICNENHRTTRL